MNKFEKILNSIKTCLVSDKNYFLIESKKPMGKKQVRLLKKRRQAAQNQYNENCMIRSNAMDIYFNW